MTAHSLDHQWSLPADILARFETGARLDEQPLALVDETVALRRCALYRNAFKGTAVSYPAELLGFDALAAWIRRHGVTVDVTTVAELDRAMARGIDPMHIVMHPHGRAVAPIRHAVNAGVGKVRRRLESSDRVPGRQRRPDPASRHRCNRRRRGRLGGRRSWRTVRLDLIGLHCRLGADDAIGAVKLRRLVAEMVRDSGANTASSSRASASPAWTSANAASIRGSFAASRRRSGR